jgi:hypothetical protein
MAQGGSKTGRHAADSPHHDTPEEFSANLERRNKAAMGLEQDLLNEMPLLYGSPGSLQRHGDPGVLLARLHREELVRRNSSGVFQSSTDRPAASLPFERTLGAMLLLFFLWGLFAS